MPSFKIEYIKNFYDGYTSEGNYRIAHVFDIIFTGNEWYERRITLVSHYKSSMTLLHSLQVLKEKSGNDADSFAGARNSQHFLRSCFGSYARIDAFAKWLESLDYTRETLPDGWDILIPVPTFD